MADASAWELAAALRGCRLTEVRAAEAALLRFGESAVPALCELLNDPDRVTRLRAIEILGRQGYPSAVAGLAPHVRSPDLDIRRRAVIALGRIATEDAVTHLEALLWLRGYGHREWAADALALAGAAAIPALCKGVRDGTGTLPRICARALYEIAQNRPVPLLQTALGPLRRRAGWWNVPKDPFAMVIEAIERALETLPDLPIPASAPAPEMSSLLIPAGDPDPDIEDLPVPSGTSEAKRSWRWWGG